MKRHSARTLTYTNPANFRARPTFSVNLYSPHTLQLVMPYQHKRMIPLSAMERILKAGGAERVSDNAKEALKDTLEKYGTELSKTAVKLALHAGRKTVQESDIKLAQTRTPQN